MDFTKGTLSGLGSHSNTGVTLPWDIKGGFVYSEADGSEKLYSFAYDVDAMRSPLAQDDHKRFYWTQNNAGATDFRFARVTDNSGAYVTTSYKVGVVADSAFSVTAGDLGMSLSVVASEPPVALSELKNMTQKFWISDANGAKLKDITSDVVSMVGVGAATANGWYKQYRIVMAHSISYYTTKTVSMVAYTPETTSVQCGAGSVPVMVNLWRNPSGVIKYIVPSDPASVEAWSQFIGSTLDVYKVNPALAGGDGGTTNYMEPVGSFYVKSKTGMSADNDAVPATLSAITTETSSPVGTTGAFVWEFDHNDQHYSTVFTTNESVSGSVDIGQGVSGTLQENVDGVTWDLYLTFASGSAYETRAYAVTFVNRLGEESAMSDAIELTLQPTKENVRVRIHSADFMAKMALLQAGADRYPLHGLRLYRSVGGQFFYAGTMKATAEATITGEVYLPVTTDATYLYFDDTTKDAGLGDACATEGYVRNNSELAELQGLTNVVNGICAAFRKNEVWLSEPYLPWAWKRANVITLPHKIVNMIPYEQGILVFTDLKTYYMSGQAPSDFIPTALPGEYPCLNKGAAVNVEGRVMFISTDGPASVNGMQVIVDQTCMTRDRWREILDYNSANGGKIKLVNYGHRVLAYFGGSIVTLDWGTVGGMMLDVSRPNWTFVDVAPKFAMHVPANSFGESADHLAFATSTEWKLAFNSPTSAEWNWWSKDFVLDHPTNFGALQIFGTGNIRYLIKADDMTPLSVDVSLGAAGKLGVIFRLPSGFRAVRWSVAFVGLSAYAGLQPQISKAFLATTVEELKRV